MNKISSALVMGFLVTCVLPVSASANLGGWLSTALSAPVMAPPVNPGAGRAVPVLSLAGIPNGVMKSVAGGAISAEVINEPSGPGRFVKKHIGQPKYEEFELTFGFGMGKTLFSWMSNMLNSNPQRMDGAVFSCDNHGVVSTQSQFFGALITEIAFPALDAASKEPAFIKVRFAPEQTRNQNVSGKCEFPQNPDEKIWLPSNFRFELGDLDTKRISRVEPFSVKMSAVTHDLGDARDIAKEPGKLEFPSLKVTLAEVGSESWSKWHSDFVINGNNDDTREKNGVIIFLSPNRQVELARLNLFNVGIYRLVPAKAEANADQIKRVTAELYVEKMTLEVK